MVAGKLRDEGSLREIKERHGEYFEIEVRVEILNKKDRREMKKEACRVLMRKVKELGKLEA